MEFTPSIDKALSELLLLELSAFAEVVHMMLLLLLLLIVFIVEYSEEFKEEVEREFGSVWFV